MAAPTSMRELTITLTAEDGAGGSPLFAGERTLTTKEYKLVFSFPPAFMYGHIAFSLQVSAR